MTNEATEEVYISKINPDNIKDLGYDESIRKHFITIEVKNPVTGACCSVCTHHNDKYFYFCQDENAFFCLNCVKRTHKPKTTIRNPEHYDFKVLVEFLLKEKTRSNNE